MSLIRNASFTILFILHRIFALESRLEYLDVIPIEEAPYLVLVLCNNSKYFCTGTILNELWVLTSASCFYDLEGIVTENEKSLLVVAGTNKLNRAAEDLKSGAAQIRQSEKYFVNENYHFNENFISDLALIQLQEPFHMTNRTLIAPLEPTHKTVNADDYGKTSGSSIFSCSLFGFGKVYLYKDNINDNSLKKQTVIVGKICFCLKMVWSKRSKTNLFMKKDLICEDSGDDTGVVTLSGLCSGDQGAPLVCDNFLRGIGTTVFDYRNRDECLLKKKGDRPNECGCRETMYVFTDLCPHSQWLSTHVPGYPVVNDYCELYFE